MVENYMHLNQNQLLGTQAFISKNQLHGHLLVQHILGFVTRTLVQFLTLAVRLHFRMNKTHIGSLGSYVPSKLLTSCE